jgi:hypothetical protein
MQWRSGAGALSRSDKVLCRMSPCTRTATASSLSFTAAPSIAISWPQCSGFAEDPYTPNRPEPRPPVHSEAAPRIVRNGADGSIRLAAARRLSWSRCLTRTRPISRRRRTPRPGNHRVRAPGIQWRGCREARFILPNPGYGRNTGGGSPQGRTAKCRVAASCSLPSARRATGPRRGP